MRSPATYSATALGGVHVMVVDAGTAVRDERSGQVIVVDDATAARKGSVIYCTQKIFDELKARTAG
jgi:hypothetical protein